jgi:hypothetical protein
MGRKTSQITQLCALALITVYVRCSILPWPSAVVVTVAT